MKKPLLLLSIILCPAFLKAQTSTDIVLLDVMVKKNSIAVSNARNITKHLGYDNQPHFHRSAPLVYYSSANHEGKMDIIAYNLSTNSTSYLTNTPENEFSPTLTPDGKHISCIIQRDNGKQDLGMFNLENKKVTILIDNLKIGYHAWIDKDNLLLFVITDSGTELQHYNLATRQYKILTTNIGRSLHKIPRQNAMSFIDKSDKEQWKVKKYDIKTGAITTIVNTLQQNEDLTWTNNGQIISSDGNYLYKYKPGKNKAWMPVALNENMDLPKGITRLATNPANNKLAIVVSE